MRHDNAIKSQRMFSVVPQGQGEAILVRAGALRSPGFLISASSSPIWRFLGAQHKLPNANDLGCGGRDVQFVVTNMRHLQAQTSLRSKTSLCYL